jgi:carbon-monoxide dehydrogenase medium subunit
MNVLELRGERLFIGAALPLNRVARHPLTAAHAQALVEACDLVGGPQVRNVATLGGNVAHALPAADGTIALLALDAEAEIANSSGLRRLPFGELFLGPGKSSLKHGEELLVGFYIRTNAGAMTASCFQRIMRPQGVALPIINLAVWVQRDGRSVKDVRIAVGPGSATPFRARSAEAVLSGRGFDGAAIDAALQALLQEIRFRSSPRRASAEYRRYLVASLFRATLSLAWERAD